MLKRATTLAIILALLGACREGASAGGFKLLSRTLLQGPSRCGTFFGDGFILGTGGGIVYFRDTDKIDERRFISLEGEPRDILIHESVAYIAAHAGGLITVDLSGPSAPRAAARFAKSRRALCCALFEKTLVLADVDYTLFTFDITRPLEPAPLGTVRLPLAPLWMAGEDDLIAVIASRKGFVYTATPAGALEKRSEIVFPENMKSGSLHKRILYALTLDGRVLRWDLRSPDNPAPLDPLPIDRASDIAFCGERGLVITRSKSVLPLEFGDAASRGAGAAHGAAIVGKAIRVGEAGGTSTGAAALLGKIKSTLSHGMIPGTEIECADSRFATIDGKNGVFFFTLEGAAARCVGNLPTPGFAVDLFAQGSTLYVANGTGGVRIGEVREDGSVEWIGHLQTTEARDLVVEGSLMALCDGAGGFKTIDVSDPRSPRIIASRKSPFYNSALVVRDRRAYIAGGLGGVEVLDFSDAAEPRLVWREEFSEVRGIDVDGEHLYFADGFDGFRIFSLAAEKPISLSVLDTEGWNCDCFVRGDIAYLADGGNGLKIADITDRAAPVLRGALDIGAITRNLHAAQGMVFAAAHTSGIAAIDASDPGAPVIAARFQTVDDGRGVYADDRFVYLASGGGGVYIFKYER